MLKIGTARSREPYDVQIADGVTFKCRPPEIADILIARGAFGAALKYVADANGVVADADAEGALAAANVAFSVALARRVIVGWSGVCDMKGKPLVVSAASIEAAMVEVPVWTGFERGYVQPTLTGLNEKNASSPSRRGTSGAKTRAKATASIASRKTRSLNGANTVRT